MVHMMICTGRRKRVVGMVMLSLMTGSIALARDVRVDVFPIPTPTSRPYTITAGPDGYLYFTESKADKIGRISVDGVITEFPIPTANCGAYGIAAGADGNIWFTERFADQIGRLNPASGQIDEFPVNTPYAQPWEITAGPDGNLWFAEEDVNQIGRITLDGSVVEYYADSCCFPTGITAGPDGNLWYTVEIGDYIVRMSPNGQQTSFPVSTEFEQLLVWDIAPGPDGNVWFTELAGRSVGRMAPNGDFVQFPIPGEFSGITGITAGPDGQMWFTENDTARIGALRTDGDVRLQQSVDSDSRPLSIIHGPDGNLWFTMADGNAIGRIRRAEGDVAYVLSMDAGFSPSVREGELGDTVQWTFVGPREHGVRDRSKLDLFDSGPLPIVSYLGYETSAAGTYRYEDTESSLTGEIRIPMIVPRRGTVDTPFTVTWAVSAPPPGLAFDVQVKSPDASGYQDWQTGVETLGAAYTPNTPGAHKFRARLRRLEDGDAIKFSPAAKVRVE